MLSREPYCRSTNRAGKEPMEEEDYVDNSGYGVLGTFGEEDISYPFLHLLKRGGCRRNAIERIRASGREKP